MAIQSIDDQGNLTWRCPHWPEEADTVCGAQHQHHIGHEAIKWHGHPGSKPEHQTVSLPPCSGCGAQTFLKVHYTEKELRAPNMWLAWTFERAQMLQVLQAAYQQAEEGSSQKMMLAQQMAELEAIRNAGGLHTESHAMALRHRELARQLKAAGKHPLGEEEQQ
ncbi:MAG TPA: hypothetical protein VFN23_07060 [Ktedonobacteraceae bacterium]|nr:hypothetical protein [Ktedonobacteraceae bacterium]